MAALLAIVASALLAPAPPLGWSSWNHFGCGVNERIVRESADALATSGMRAAGYRYVNVDDCWMAASRGPGGALRTDPKKFPSGIPALAAHVHARGLKLGLYTSLGAHTCQGRPALGGHEAADLRRLASWGVDYLKVDFCGVSDAVKRDPEPAYRRIQELIDAGPRPLVLSVSSWGQGAPWKWRPRAGQLWRVTGDIRPEWKWILRIAGRSNLRARYAGPGGWNDPDMLEVGNRGLSAREARAHFSLWAMLAAPLIAGNDVRHLSRATRRTLLNREVLAVDQDPLGRQGRRVRGGRHEVWVKRLGGGARAVLLLNRSRRAATLSADLGNAASYRVRDLWRHRSRRSGPRLRARVRGHGVALFRVRR